MYFNVTLIDPPTYKWAYFLTDTCRTIAAGLRSLGHQCDLTVNNLDNSATNIIVGGHLLTPADATSIGGMGAKYVLFQSEALYADPGTGDTRSAFLSSGLHATHIELYRRAQAVWECLDSNMPLVEQLGIPRERIKLYVPGFHADLCDVRHRPAAEKNIDVLFFGSTTERRLSVFKDLERHARLVVLFDAPSAIRNDFIARARINLALQSDPKLSYLAPQRTGYLLNNRCVIVADQAKAGGSLDDLVCMVPHKDVVATCSAMLASADLDKLADAAFEGYRERPITAVLQQMLEP